MGLVLSRTLVVQVPEMGMLSYKQIAALVGVAPFNRDSHTLRGRRTVYGGRAPRLAVLDTGTLVATKKLKPVIKTFSTRLCAAGKAKKVALVALRCILRHRVHRGGAVPRRWGPGRWHSASAAAVARATRRWLAALASASCGAPASPPAQEL